MDETNYLDVVKVKTLRKKKGNPQINWLCKELGLSRTAGFHLFTHGILPKDEARATEVLEKLSAILSAEGPASLLRSEVKRTA